MRIPTVTHENIPMRFSTFMKSLAVATLVMVSATGQSSPFNSRTADSEANGTHPSFEVKTVGQGRPIIMIPGLASSGSTWDGTVGHLSPRYRCIELTLAGFAGVPPSQERHLLASARDQIADYIRDNHLEKPVILGHSLGGSIALDLASHYAGLVGPVIIVDSLPFFAGVWFQADSLESAKPAITGMRAGMEAMTPAQWKAHTQSGASTNGMASSTSDQQLLIQWALASDQKTVIDSLIDLVSSDLRPGLGQIETPVLVIGSWVGLQNYGVTMSSATALFQQQYAGVKHLQFVMAEKARHFVMLDDPSWFYSEIDAFLAASNGTGGSPQLTQHGGH